LSSSSVSMRSHRNRQPPRFFFFSTIFAQLPDMPQACIE
jgi:hypothetical protein